MSIRAGTTIAILTACVPAATTRSGQLPRPSPSPTTTQAAAPVAAAIMPPATPAARGWEAWPVWAYLEAGSATLRARLESEWGGITQLSHGQLPLLADVTGVSEAFTVTFAAIRDHIDVTRPMRQLTSRGDRHVAWAIAFAARASASASDQLPTICRGDPAGPFHAVEVAPPGEWCAPCGAVERPGDRAIVCGQGDAAAALRDDFVARGLSGTADVIHAEQHLDWHSAPSRVVFDVHATAGALHATIEATPRTPRTGGVSTAAFAAASRVQARSSRVDVGGPYSAPDEGLTTPLGFDGFDVGPDRVRIDDRRLIFVETTVDKLASRVAAHWRGLQRHGRTVRVASPRVPAGLPAGARRLRRQEWVRDDGTITRCSLSYGMGGGCRVVRHRPPSRRLELDADYVLIPGDGGTWIATGHDRNQLAAVLDVVTSGTTPPTWTLPAAALGKQTIGRAELLWAEHVLANGDLQFEIDGTLKP